jgi:hypothetical protein
MGGARKKGEGREKNSACRKAISFHIFRVRERTRNSDWLITHQGFPNSLWFLWFRFIVQNGGLSRRE